MKTKSKKQVCEMFKLYCDDCLEAAVDEYISRASGDQLQSLAARIQVSLSAPF